MKNQTHQQKIGKSVPVSFSRTNSNSLKSETHFIDSFSDSAIHLQRLHAAAWIPYFSGLRMGVVK